MKIFALITAAAMLLCACDKEDFQTKPKIEIESADPDIVSVDGSVKITMKFTDKEGDVDDSLYIIRERLNVRDVSPGKVRTIDFKIASFPDKQSGAIDVILNHTLLTFGNSVIPIPGALNQPDTISLRFYVRDAAKNTSDTVTLNKNIIVIR